MRTWLLIWIAALSFEAGWAQAAQPPQVELKWADLGPAVTNKKVALILPDGTYVEARVSHVEQDGLRLKVSMTSNRKIQPKGENLIPRQAISTLRATEYRHIGRLLGTTGAIALAAGIVLANDIDIYEGPLLYIVPAVIAGGMAGSAIGGYYVGKAFDKKVTEIRIAPD